MRGQAATAEGKDDKWQDKSLAGDRPPVWLCSSLDLCLYY